MKQIIEMHNKKNNKNAGGRKGVVKKNRIKVIKIIEELMPFASSISLAPLLFKKELNKLILVKAKPKDTNMK
ncbi:hypothetical protein N9H19_01635 [Flavobacteriales bacterium]|nr:hypothetical protein [Flavobacteriales bacterium]